MFGAKDGKTQGSDKSETVNCNMKTLRLIYKLHYAIMYFVRIRKSFPMRLCDSRGAALAAFDASAREFSAECAARHEAGAAQAACDTHRLAALAERLADDVAAWGRIVNELDVARQTPLAPNRAGQLVAETVFDEVLDPGAVRVLTAALDLATTRW